MITETVRGTRVFREELSPVSFLERAGTVHSERVAAVDGERRYTYAQWRARSRRLASALRGAGLRKDDRVAFLALNSEPLLLAHFGVPQAGGIMVAVNTRLTADDVAYIVEHSGASWIFHSPELAPQLASVPASVRRVDISTEFDALLEQGSDGEVESWLDDEDDVISINYTSGTTGRPKGVMYHHRGAYLNALAMALHHRLTEDSAYLWTLPMFHCNGWCFTWAGAAVGAAAVCIPAVDAERVWGIFDRGEATHFCGAPTVLTMLVNHPRAHRLERPVRLFTAGAPPSPAIIGQMAELNFDLHHVYGLTETYGPFTLHETAPSTDALAPEERARVLSRQGTAHVTAGQIRVVDESMADVPADGETMGEVVFRGNVVMKGYYENDEATAQAFSGGWFHSGDVGVMHPDGRIELRDRKKDIIISGGENISSIEVERAIGRHPAVVGVAVVATPSEKWGERPKAFVELVEGAEVSQEEILAFAKRHLAGYMRPDAVEFTKLTRTATGKIEKTALREREWMGRDRKVG
ncbi:MAG TPA: AMP-binding protein, partial [Candidatus Dormibacteraeota bacterium]